jgi:hypothetical protein
MELRFGHHADRIIGSGFQGYIILRLRNFIVLVRQVSDWQCRTSFFGCDCGTGVCVFSLASRWLFSRRPRPATHRGSKLRRVLCVRLVSLNRPDLRKCRFVALGIDCPVCGVTASDDCAPGSQQVSISGVGFSDQVRLGCLYRADTSILP